MTLFTIGFTRKSAETFFTLLQEAGARRVVDIRLNNSSQLAGFAKARDLAYLLRAIGGIDYLHQPMFAPTADILDAFKKKELAWDAYERAYDNLMNERDADAFALAALRDGDCLLCSEHDPAQCHRRLFAERLLRHNPDLEIAHL